MSLRNPFLGKAQASDELEPGELPDCESLFLPASDREEIPDPIDENDVCVSCFLGRIHPPSVQQEGDFVSPYAFCV